MPANVFERYGRPVARVAGPLEPHCPGDTDRRTHAVEAQPLLAHPRARASIIGCKHIHPHPLPPPYSPLRPSVRLAQVIVVTNLYDTPHGKRVGVRHMANGLKVYYLPIVPMADQAALPTYYAFFPALRQILLRERVTIVHGHAATSPLEHECILQARTMGYKACYTDHSLFGFADAASINVNKYLKATLSDVEHAICVSHTCRENLVLRAALDPRRVSTIPNAVDASKFTPNPSARPSDPRIVNIVMVSRLVYRKGIDLVVNVIPTICQRFPHVRFIIGGDGPKKLLLEEMRERHQLHDRVELLGAVAHKSVRDVLSRGHIFLNASLTESFCIAILEAACCGCFCVSTRVGGVPEVLPQRMIRFAEPTPEHLAEAIAQAIPLAKHVDPYSFHAELREMYNWPEVAARTVRVYDIIAAAPPVPLVERYRRYFGIGRVFGPLSVILCTLLYFFWVILDIVWPACDIDVVPDLPWDDIDERESPAVIKAAHVAVTAGPLPAPAPAPAPTPAAAADPTPAVAPSPAAALSSSSAPLPASASSQGKPALAQGASATGPAESSRGSSAHTRRGGGRGGAGVAVGGSTADDDHDDDDRDDDDDDEDDEDDDEDGGNAPVPATAPPASMSARHAGGATDGDARADSVAPATPPGSSTPGSGGGASVAASSAREQPFPALDSLRLRLPGLTPVGTGRIAAHDGGTVLATPTVAGGTFGLPDDEDWGRSSGGGGGEDGALTDRYAVNADGAGGGGGGSGRGGEGSAAGEEDGANRGVRSPGRRGAGGKGGGGGRKGVRRTE
jgi:phosphatidylinositol N-acetylglucosaminyltransferase subunit A